MNSTTNLYKHICFLDYRIDEASICQIRLNNVNFTLFNIISFISSLHYTKKKITKSILFAHLSVNPLPNLLPPQKNCSIEVAKSNCCLLQHDCKSIISVNFAVV